MKSGFVYVISTDGAYDKANGDKPMGEKIQTTVDGDFEEKTIAKSALGNFYVYDSAFRNCKCLQMKMILNRLQDLVLQLNIN